MPFERDIEVPRNSSYFRSWKFKDAECDAPLNIAGWSFSLQVKSVAAVTAPVIAAAYFTDNSGRNGTVNVRIDGSDFGAVDGVQENVRLPYDFLARDEDGIVTTQFRGFIILTPGVSSI